MRRYTEWFPPEIKPVRVGVYETSLMSGWHLCGFTYWDGNMWSNQQLWPKTAYKQRDYKVDALQAKPWRGLVRSYGP